MGGGRRRRRQVHGKRKGAEAGQPPPPLVVGAEDALVARLALSPHAVREAAGGHRHRLGSRAAADRHRSHPVLHAAHSQPVRGAFGASRCPHQPRGGCQLRVHQRGLPRLAGRRILQAAWRVCGGGGGGHDRPSAHHDRLQLLPLPLRAGHRPPVPARLAVWHLGHRAVPSHALLLARAGSAHLRRRVRNAPSLHVRPQPGWARLAGASPDGADQPGRTGATGRRSYGAWFDRRGMLHSPFRLPPVPEPPVSAESTRHPPLFTTGGPRLSPRRSSSTGSARGPSRSHF
mmetsp:Transcript_5061/g.16730  ORF Transcript_5061/g.16730 Transcript_5061/m.16730 type:complete len:288 (+) Transcript_5061:1012-1875(+)